MTIARRISPKMRTSTSPPISETSGFTMASASDFLSASHSRRRCTADDFAIHDHWLGAARIRIGDALELEGDEACWLKAFACHATRASRPRKEPLFEMHEPVEARF